eukprot:gene1476-13079_t
MVWLQKLSTFTWAMKSVQVYVGCGFPCGAQNPFRVSDADPECDHESYFASAPPRTGR